jgi:predicted  nucleic acid-binding Zn-ribbon protein
VAAHTALYLAPSALRSLDETWVAEQADLAEQIKAASAELATLEPVRVDQASGIDPELLAKYDHIRLVHQGRGIAKLDRNLCLGI